MPLPPHCATDKTDETREREREFGLIACVHGPCRRGGGRRRRWGSRPWGRRASRSGARGWSLPCRRPPAAPASACTSSTSPGTATGCTRRRSPWAPRGTAAAAPARRPSRPHPPRHRHHRVPLPPRPGGRAAATPEHDGQEVVGDQERPHRYHHQHRRRQPRRGGGLPRRRVHLSGNFGGVWIRGAARLLLPCEGSE